MASVVVNGDTSGAVTLSAPAVAGTVTVTLPSTSGTMLTTASTTGISGSAISSGTVPEAYGGTGTSTGYYGFKNRIINGAMAVAQRGTTSTSTGYQTVDRWQVNNCTNQAQVTSAPTGFINSLEITGTVAGSSGYGLVNQYIESKNVLGLLGNNCTLSAWVKNTGTSTANVSCEVYYANTTDNFSAVTLISSPTSQPITTGWTRITFPVIAVPSAASTGIAIRLFRYDGSNSQKWEITGVQFELGSTATSFDYRPYGTELALCQRYFWSITGDANGAWGNGQALGTTSARLFLKFPVTMRASPTLSYTGSPYVTASTGSGRSITSFGTNYGGITSTQFESNISSGGLTAGNAVIAALGAGTDMILASSEL